MAELKRAAHPLAGLRVVLCLALVLVISQFYRTAVAAIAPELMRTLALAPESMGAISAAFFLGFAAMQIPVGLMLDRFGPRRTVSAVLVVAVAGALTFATAEGAAGLVLGQALLGIGCSGVFMGALVATARWFPPARFATVAAVIMATSNTGNLLSATPLAAAAEAVGWRGAFLALAGLTALLALLVVLVVRDAPPGHARESRAPESLGAALRGLLEVLRDKRLPPLLAMACIAYPLILVLRSLWAGPYLSDIHGLEGVALGDALLIMSVAMIVGIVSYGPLDKLFDTRKGIMLWGGLATLAVLGVLAAVPGLDRTEALVLLVLLAFLGSNYVMTMPHARAFYPERLVGRAVTTVNLVTFVGVAVWQALTGLIVGAFAAPGEPAPEIAYRAVFAFLAGVLALALMLYRRVEDVPPSRDR